MYSLEIEIPIAPTDSNKILGVNKFVKHKIFQQVKKDISNLAHGKAPDKPLKSFLISVERHSMRFLDYDNYIASLKPAIDALKLCGVIHDDSWEFIKSIDVGQIKSKDKKLIIKVEEVV